MTRIASGRRKIMPVQVYKIGDVCNLVGISRPTIKKMLDGNKDLSFVVGEDRRITHDNLLVLLSRVGITPKHIGLNLSKQFLWIGRPVPGYEMEGDRSVTVVGAMHAASRNEARAVVCINHDLPANDLILMAKTFSEKSVMFAARLPDDAAKIARKTDRVWLYHSDEHIPLLEIMCWLRDIEVAHA